jgi:hypothetical protein
MSGIFSTPRPLPSRKWSSVAGAATIVVALPVVIAAGAPVAGWGLALALWAAGEALAAALGKLPLGLDTLTTSGVRGVGMTLRTVAIMVVLVAVTVADKDVGITAALVFIATYSFELLVSLATYFGGKR